MNTFQLRLCPKNSVQILRVSLRQLVCGRGYNEFGKFYKAVGETYAMPPYPMFEPDSASFL